MCALFSSLSNRIDLLYRDGIHYIRDRDLVDKILIEKDENLLRISLEEEEKIAKPWLALPNGLVLGCSDNTLLFQVF